MPCTYYCFCGFFVVLCVWFWSMEVFCLCWNIFFSAGWFLFWWLVSHLIFTFVGLCKVKRPFWWAHLNIWEFKFSDDVLSDIPPHLKLSLPGGQLLDKQCLKWEPIWNCHNSFTLLSSFYVVICCWATGQVSHIFITWENALISVNFQLLFLLCFWLHIVVVVYYATTTSTTTTTTSMRMTRFV